MGSPNYIFKKCEIVNFMNLEIQSKALSLVKEGGEYMWKDLNQPLTGNNVQDLLIGIKSLRGAWLQFFAASIAFIARATPQQIANAARLPRN